MSPATDSSGDSPARPDQPGRRRRHLAHLRSNLCEFDKEDATRTWKKSFGFHPLLGFVDHGGMDQHGGTEHHRGGGEPVAELLRPGKAGSNTAADHVTVLDAALAQIPAA